MKKTIILLVIATLLFPALNLPAPAKAATKNVWTQTSWTGGYNQTTWSDQTKFATTTGEGVYASTTLRMKINADVVIGQNDFVSGDINQGEASSTASSINQLAAVYVHEDGKVFIADERNNRVLIYNQIPTTNGVSADIVIGQTDFVSNEANQGGSTTAATLNRPTGVHVYDEKLFISDHINNRVLIYNTVPTTNGASADVVIGQNDFESDDINQGLASSSATSMNNPHAVFAYNGKLIVADRKNHRTLIYNNIPTTNGVSADVVIGQENFVSSEANQGGLVGADTQNDLASVYVHDGKLLISDNGNHRVLVYMSIPTTNGENADLVIGQEDFLSNGRNQLGDSSLDANTQAHSHPVTFVDNRLLISEYFNNRVGIYNVFPAENNASMDEVLGQPDFTSRVEDVSQYNFKRAVGVAYYPGSLLVSGQLNHRVLVFNLSPNSTTLTSSIIDAGTEQEWGPVSWNASTTDYSSINVEVSLNNGSTWMEVSNGQEYIGSSDTLQYRVTLANNDGLSSPTFHDISISYATTSAPAAFSLASPANSASTEDHPDFTWNASSDSESGLASYSLYVDNSLFKSGISHSATSYTAESALSCGEHTWYVKAIDNADNTTSSDTRSFKIACSGSLPIWMLNNRNNSSNKGNTKNTSSQDSDGNEGDNNNDDNEKSDNNSNLDKNNNSENDNTPTPTLLSKQNKEIVETVSQNEANAIYFSQNYVDMDPVAKNAYNKLFTGKSNVSSNLNRTTVAAFINNGTDTTKRLGAGERAGVIDSYFQAFGVFPQNQTEWQDIIKIANGRWPRQSNKEALNLASTLFEQIYLREANIDNPNDNAAVTIMTYGLRPSTRNTESETAAIKIYQSIFKSTPLSARNWDAVRAIAYSGAVR